MDKDIINININIGTIIRFFLVMILLALLYFFQNLVLSILTAIVLASSLEPVIQLIERKKIPRIFSAIIVYILLFLLMSAVVFIFVPQITAQFTEIYNQLPKHIDALNVWLKQITGAGDVVGKTFSVLQERFFGSSVSVDAESSILENSSFFSKSVLLFFQSIFNFILIIVLSFYFALQKHGVEKFITIVTSPKYTNYAINLWKRSQVKIGYWMQGQLILAVVIGAVTYLGLLVFFGFEQSLLLAFLAAIAELIPVLGPFLAAIPAIGIGLTTGGATLALSVLVFYLVIQMIESQLIYPLVVKKVVGVPSFVVIISLIIGAQLFGFLGVILSIPVAAAIMEFIKDVEKKQKEALKKGEVKEIHLAKKK